MRVIAAFFAGVIIGAILGYFAFTFFGEPNQTPKPMFEQAISGNFDGSPTYPRRRFRAGGPAFLDIETAGPNRTHYCIEVLYVSSCGEIERAFSETTMIAFTPHCQRQTMAFEFELVGENVPNLSLYYIDGRVTESRNEAQSWAANDHSCVIPSVIESDH